MARKRNGFWTYENCLTEAKKYKTRTEYQKNSQHSYRVALSNGWLKWIAIHMPIRAKGG